MATRPTKAMDARVSAAETAFQNTIKYAAIKAKAEEKGYDSAEMTKGLDYVAEARAMIQEKEDWQGEVWESTKAEAAAKKIAVKAYQGLAKIARAKWDPHAPELQKLGLIGNMPAATDLFVEAGLLLVENILNNSDIKDYFLKRGYDDTKLHDVLVKIKEYETANADQNALIGQSKDKTDNQTNSINTLDEWFQEFKEVMKEALTLSQQRSLGLIKRTGRTEAQKQAGKKASATKKAKKNP